MASGPWLQGYWQLVCSRRSLARSSLLACTASPRLCQTATAPRAVQRGPVQTRAWCWWSGTWDQAWGSCCHWSPAASATSGFCRACLICGSSSAGMAAAPSRWSANRTCTPWSGNCERQRMASLCSQRSRAGSSGEKRGSTTMERAGRHCCSASGSEGAALSTKDVRSEEHTSELQSHLNLVCRLLLEKKKKQTSTTTTPMASIIHKTPPLLLDIKFY